MDVKIFTKTARSAFAFGLAVCALAICAPGDRAIAASGYGTVIGRVVDTDSLQPIAGARITIGNIVSITAATDNGGFIIRNVPAGTATLTISAVGWKSYATQITVVDGQPTDTGVIGLPSSLNR
jgi:iron complex outermembrane receptor protein